MALLPSGMVLAIPVALLLAGCVTFTADGGMAPVASQVSGDIGGQVVKITSEEEAASARARVSALLSRPLDARAALQVALLNNRGLQAQYNALGISEAAYVAASLPPNPTFGVERLNGGGELDVERRLVANVLALLTLPARSEIAAAQFEAARQRAVEATFRTAAEARRAYYRAVASRQTEALLEKARLTTDAAADLTVKLGETGAATKLDQARASAFYAEISNELARARLKSATDREALTRQLGLWGNDVGYKLPSQLPHLPGRIRTEPQVEVEAVLKRTDLIAARLELDAMAKSLGLTQATRFISLLEGGYRGNYQRANGETLRPQGFELEVQVPIFDLGETNVRRAQETYMQAVNRLMEKAVNVRSEARAAYVTYRASYDIARLYQARILPLRKTVNEQALLEYNGMLIDVFELLTTERESIDSNVSAIGAQRDFFLAEVDFQTAIIGGGAGGGETVFASASAGASD
ncbi:MULTISPECIES: TolC family protein [Xanthobacter]|uniref:TolC family protein n=1 Tax=Xanthobacter TaxID=279 RepID=UPI002022F003|nr:TolC family protein [Xanthobacter aminoxidans]MCL8383425.1 TolC family protein [Xanthobacter aminoxidans]